MKRMSVVLNQNHTRYLNLLSNDVAERRDYSARLQSDKVKVAFDFFIGFCGELASYLAYRTTHKVTMPKFWVFSEEERSYSQDIFIDNIKTHVKSVATTRAKRYGHNSWTFGMNDPALNSPNEQAVFIEVEDTSMTAEALLCYVYPIYKMKDLTFSEPLNKKFLGKKVCVNEMDLPKEP